MNRKKITNNCITSLNMFVVFFNKHINLRMGTYSGLATGSIVFLINVDHGLLSAFASFGKQFAFNIFIAGFNTKTCEKLVRVISDRTVAIVAATVIPALQAFFILYVIHYFGHTPKPLASTLWQLGANLFFFFLLAFAYQKNMSIQHALEFISRTLKKEK